MKQLRFLIIGIVFGGAFGAKLSTYLTSLLDNSISLQFIEFGFLLGAGIGLMISLIVKVTSAGVLKKDKNESSATSVMTYSS